jgi:hypothetical protein
MALQPVPEAIKGAQAATKGLKNEKAAPINRFTSFDYCGYCLRGNNERS